MLRVQPQHDECDVGPLSGRHRAHFLDVDLACDHLVPEPRHDLREQLETVTLLVGDEDAKVWRLVLGHRSAAPSRVARTRLGRSRRQC